MVYHPDFASEVRRRKALTQTTDLMPTLLDMAGLAIPPDVTGHSLMPVRWRGRQAGQRDLWLCRRECDGRYSYFRYPTVSGAESLHEYTLMPTRGQRAFLFVIFLGDPHPSFSFTKGVPVLELARKPMMRDNRSRFRAWI